MVASSSSPIKRLYPTTSALRIAASLRVIPGGTLGAGSSPAAMITAPYRPRTSNTFPLNRREPPPHRLQVLHKQAHGDLLAELERAHVRCQYGDRQSGS